MMKKIFFIQLLCLLFFFSRCKKFTEVPFPVNQVGSEQVFENDETAKSAVAGIYSEIMGNPNQLMNCSITFYAGMSADELVYYSPDVREEFITNNITIQNHPLLSGQFWAPAYKMIYVLNLSLKKLEASGNLSASVKERLKGECYYMRALHYFMMVNLFGDVPLCLTSDYLVNQGMSRTASELVYSQIIDDLKKASELLPESYALADRSVPNKWAAKALLSKVYLYNKQWNEAKVSADEVLGSGLYQLAGNLNEVFLKSSREVLWQMASVVATRNSWEGFYILPNSNNSLPTYLVRNELLNHFENGDQRKVSWVKQRTYQSVNMHYPFKYKVKQNATITEYQVVMRLAEVRLIRAEAQLELNAISAAVTDLNTVRVRAGLTAVSININADSCRRLLVKERQSELFVEWGNRWFDLKRWNMAGAVLGPIKGSNWQPTDVLYPVPQNEIELNGNLIQNPGY